MRPTAVPALLVFALIFSSACADAGSDRVPVPPAAPAVEAPRTAVALDEMQACVECHASVVAAFGEHGMARSIGPVGTPEAGVVVNPRSGNRYEIVVDAQGAWLKGTTPGGGTRYQRLVGRVGAGLFDTSWIGEEIDPFTSEATGRLFFTPVETIAGHGLELSPFELHPNSAGLDLGFNEGCMTCHTEADPARLPRAATAPDGRTVYPANLLGADAFDHLAPLSCRTCHGDARAHVDMMTGLPDARDEGLGLPALGRLPPGAQRDVCARCHLQGDARFELTPGFSRTETPLAGQIPVLVPVHADDDFRFVGQLERLALSACFRAAPAMTCTTCHDAHTGVAAQGTESFDAACMACHEVAPQHTSLTVRQVTGEAARTRHGCVDCHVRRSQPFDLLHVRTADHFIRRRIPRPATSAAHRQFADPDGPVQVFDDGRLAEPLGTPPGQRWADGVVAMGLVSMGRLQEAARRFDAFPPPGTEQARQATAPPGLTPLETHPSFHHMRGLALMVAGRPEEAMGAFSDALTLDPYYAGARLERAKLRVLTNDLQGALKDTDELLAAHPKDEKAWNIRSTLALRIGSVEMAASALEVSTRLWASDAKAWKQLGLLYQELGRAQEAQQALERAQALEPALRP